MNIWSKTFWIIAFLYSTRERHVWSTLLPLILLSSSLKTILHLFAFPRYSLEVPVSLFWSISFRTLLTTEYCSKYCNVCVSCDVYMASWSRRRHWEWHYFNPFPTQYRNTLPMFQHSARILFPCSNTLPESSAHEGFLRKSSFSHFSSWKTTFQCTMCSL